MNKISHICKKENRKLNKYTRFCIKIFAFIYYIYRKFAQNKIYYVKFAKNS